MEEFQPIDLINLGSGPNTGTGNPIRNGGDKINANFEELDKRTRPGHGLHFKHKGSQGGVPNEGLEYERGDWFHGQTATNIVVLAAQWKGTDINDPNDYNIISFYTIDEENQI